MTEKAYRMPASYDRKARIDITRRTAPGGIAAKRFLRRCRCGTFIERPGPLLPESETRCLVWPLIPIHFQLLLRTGNVSIAQISFFIGAEVFATL